MYSALPETTGSDYNNKCTQHLLRACYRPATLEGCDLPCDLRLTLDLGVCFPREEKGREREACGTARTGPQLTLLGSWDLNPVSLSAETTSLLCQVFLLLLFQLV